MKRPGRRSDPQMGRWTVLRVVAGLAFAAILIVGSAAMRLGMMGMVPSFVKVHALLTKPTWTSPVSDARFPHMLKFHKVAGTFLTQALWYKIDHGPLATAWREDLCGDFQTHKLSFYQHGALQHCSLTSSYRVITLLRSPLHKILSSLFWYAPDSALSQRPWTTYIGNWTAADARYMVDAYLTTFQAAGTRYEGRIPPLNEYTSVLSYPNAPSQSRALRNLRSSGIIVGITESMEESFVLVALVMGWPVDDMLPCYSPGVCLSAKVASRHSVGSYDSISAAAREVLLGLAKDDVAVYEAGREIHARQRRSFPQFDSESRRFKGLVRALKNGTLLSADLRGSFSEQEGGAKRTPRGEGATTRPPLR